ncbi:MAG: YHS domain-containing protein [Flavobacterium sp.]|uniref:YHS domain-containing protein n=1 Tax=Flavobacterium sp. TaxID=239 RepID=UPI002625ABDD|nr:YHS domain-containing protein [Flavobacterium sp.]MDD5149565.1 YHS domain-containing protein [Flavobacterium sp.]
MKKVLFLLCATIFFSCVQKEANIVKETTSLIEPENPLNKLKYDNKIDFYCQMDITEYGVSDTTNYKGKLYGFCSKMCKDEFLKTPEEYLAKK